MPRFKIVFYGKEDLEGRVFQAYMRALGYPTEIASTHAAVFDALALGQRVVLVLTSHEPARPFEHFVQEVAADADPRTTSIFVLGDIATGVTALPIQIISRPFRLSEIANRIHQLAHAHV